MGKETSGPDKPHMRPGMNEHPDATPANRPGPVDDKPFVKRPNGGQKVNHEIGEAYPDAGGLAPQAERPRWRSPATPQSPLHLH